MSASIVERSVFVYRAGANKLRNATHAVIVYKMDMDVLIVTICPNLENGRIVVCVRGMAATIVVSALLAMDTPMWLSATSVLHFFRELRLCG